MARTDERAEFLQDLLATALAASRYWMAECVTTGPDAVQITCIEGGPTVVADLEVIERGLAAVGAGTATYSNAGYAGTVQERISSVDRDNAMGSAEYDAIDADCLLQIGLWGTVQFG
ncbi:hypothetical protein MUG78_16875 [Gordonia alkaliphila]|uniref:hypothetical protein n=1 Tax=Gordonia alkaliphila TaxID=1053547 RepID=UPI001FF35671|nr:hypothetical protein [Gordonia alkaliphila]MCK0441075.1 hypothetical protein [Gordonia alkaliphila]